MINTCNIVIEISNQQVMKAITDGDAVVIVIDNDHPSIKRIPCANDPNYVNEVVETSVLVETAK